MTEQLKLNRLDVAGADERRDEVVGAYVEVYADTGDEFFGEERFRRQIASHMTAPSWEMVTADLGTSGKGLVGFVYGFALPAATGWWRGLLTDVPAGFTDEDGRRTVAISEILVRASWRRQGLGRRLHDTFLAGRSEGRATLLVEPDNAPAQAAYAAWGWRKVAQLRPGWEGAPLYDVLIRPLDGDRYG